MNTFRSIYFLVSLFMFISHHDFIGSTDLNHDGVSPLVALGSEGGQLCVQHVPGLLDQLLGCLVLPVVDAQHSSDKVTKCFPVSYHYIFHLVIVYQKV